MTLLEAAERVLAFERTLYLANEAERTEFRLAIAALEAAVREERARLNDMHEWVRPHIGGIVNGPKGIVNYTLHKGEARDCQEPECRARLEETSALNAGQWKQGVRGELRPGDPGYERAEPTSPPTSVGEPCVIDGPTK